MDGARTREAKRHVNQLDIVIGLTYGTGRPTNNTHNQILVKLLQKGFVEEDQGRTQGVLMHSETRSVRISRCISINFWSLIGNPSEPSKAAFVHLEVLLALAKALSKGIRAASVEEPVNLKSQQLPQALAKLSFP